jgi:hypothetical protein
MADMPKQRRNDLLDKAVSAAVAGLANIEALSNSGNPDIAADATADLVDAGNARDDLATIRAIVDTKPENALKPVSDQDLAQLAALESAIDARIRNNQLISAGLTAATDIIQTAQSIGQILKEG